MTRTDRIIEGVVARLEQWRTVIDHQPTLSRVEVAAYINTRTRKVREIQSRLYLTGPAGPDES